MPNNGRITKCPFYMNERNSYITCEDAKHRFRYRKTKEDYMDAFCDDRWQLCPYAAALEKAYKDQEGDDAVIRNAARDAKLKSLEKENKRVNVMLSKAEARLKEHSQKTADLKRRLEVATKQYASYKDKYEELKALEQKAMEQINEAAMLCEARVAYLLSTKRDKRLDEEKFQAWHEKHEYALVPEMEEGKLKSWKLESRISVKEIMDGTEGSTSEPESPGRSEAEGSGEATSEEEGK